MPDSEADGLSNVRDRDTRPFWKLFTTYGQAELPKFVVGTIASVLRMVMELIPTVVLAVAIDSLFFDTTPFALPLVPTRWLPESTGEQFLLVLGIMAVVYALNSALGWLNSYMWNSFAQHVQHSLRVDTYEAVQGRPVTFFDEHQTGDIMSILNNDVNQLEEFLTTHLNNLVVIVVRVGGMGVIMLLINWKLALIPVLTIPLLGFLSHWFVQSIGPKYRRVRKSVGKLNSRLENNVSGITTVKAFAREPFERNRVTEASAEYLDTQWNAITTRILYFPTMQLMTAAGYISVFGIGGWWVVTGSPPMAFYEGTTLTAGTLVLFLNYSQRFIYPMRRMGQIINGYQYAQAAGERIFGLMDADSGSETTDGSSASDDIEGDIDYENVSFSYGNDSKQDTERVLEDVSFDVEPGEYVGVVGRTGAGKSTLLKLLLRFYDPDSGTVRVDGRDVQDISLGSLRKSIGYVSQEPYIFYGTVAENIGYGRPEADKDDIRAAASAAGADSFVRDLEDGYDTMVGERGVKLSGGQRQRIAIARALLHDHDILILDEATSHVDNETEAAIQQNLTLHTEGKTTFAVAHQLSTVRNADRILVLDEGELVEQGTHEELLDADGLYSTLWQIQLGNLQPKDDAFTGTNAEVHSP
nr:ABC transporter ATP-binding protein [Halomicroarcula sp. YJ-61-S]